MYISTEKVTYSFWRWVFIFFRSHLRLTSDGHTKFSRLGITCPKVKEKIPNLLWNHLGSSLVVFYMGNLSPNHQRQKPGLTVSMVNSKRKTFKNARRILSASLERLVHWVLRG